MGLKTLNFNKEVIQMKYKDVYEKCKKLASCGETSEKPGVFEKEVYIDSFGCDLQIYRSNVRFPGLSKMQESIKVYFGGRRVYAFYETHPDWESVTNGYWEKLVADLWNYERAIYWEDSYSVNGTLLELCRRESARNREILNGYRENCILLVRRSGVLKIYNSGTSVHSLKKAVDGHTIEILLVEKPHKEEKDRWNKIELYFDRKIKFSFYWNCSTIGSEFDEKGEYIPGEWERILEKIIEEK